MKQASRFLGLAAVAVSIGILASTTLAETGHFGSGGSRNSHRDGGYHRGGYYGGHYGGHYGGWGWRGWFPFGFSFVYAPSPYYYGGYYNSYPPAAYYPPPTVYGSQPTVDYNSPPPAAVAESPEQPDGDRPLSPTAVDRDSPPPPPRDQGPPQMQHSDQGQSSSVAELKALAKAGLSDEVILSHIRNSQAVYHLTTAEIIDLKESGVSEKIIDYMINTASPQR